MYKISFSLHERQAREWAVYEADGISEDLGVSQAGDIVLGLLREADEEPVSFAGRFHIVPGVLGGWEGRAMRDSLYRLIKLALLRGRVLPVKRASKFFAHYPALWEDVDDNLRGISVEVVSGFNGGLRFWYSIDSFWGLAWLEVLKMVEANLTIKSCRKCAVLFYPEPSNVSLCPACRLANSRQDQYYLRNSEEVNKKARSARFSRKLKNLEEEKKLKEYEAYDIRTALEERGLEPARRELKGKLKRK